VDAIAFDYSADALGYEEGATIELNQKTWALRYGFFTVPARGNQNGTDGHYLKAWDQILELEERYTLFGHPGKLRLLGYLERAHMGSYRAVLDEPSLNLNLAGTRRYRLTEGFEINLEQEITSDLGAFLRLAARNPNYESWQFSDASRSRSIVERHSVGPPKRYGRVSRDGSGNRSRRASLLQCGRPRNFSWRR